MSAGRVKGLEASKRPRAGGLANRTHRRCGRSIPTISGNIVLRGQKFAGQAGFNGRVRFAARGRPFGKRIRPSARPIGTKGARDRKKERGGDSKGRERKEGREGGRERLEKLP